MHGGRWGKWSQLRQIATYHTNRRFAAHPRIKCLANVSELFSKPSDTWTPAVCHNVKNLLVSECKWAPSLCVCSSLECKHILSVDIRKEWQGEGEEGGDGETCRADAGETLSFSLSADAFKYVMAVTYCMDKNIKSCPVLICTPGFFISATIHVRTKMFCP